MSARSFLIGAVTFAVFAVIGVLAMIAPAVRGQTTVELPRPKRREFDAAAMLDAIAAVESGKQPWRVGPKGERGRCQILHTTWVRYTNADFERWASIDCELTRRIERAHLRYLVAKFFSGGSEINIRLLAAAWHWENDGPKHLRSDYAQHVENLYSEAVK